MTTTINPACPPHILPRRTASATLSDPHSEPSDPPLTPTALALALARRDERIALIALPALLARARDGYAAAGRPGDARRCDGLIG
jgi:hypothetical protein